VNTTAKCILMANEIFHRETVAIPVPANMVVISGVQQKFAVSNTLYIRHIHKSIRKYR